MKVSSEESHFELLNIQNNAMTILKGVSENCNVSRHGRDIRM